MQYPLVSIIIPTYNRETLLKRAVESVLGQTHPNWELLIIDDGSTDSTWQMLLSQLSSWKRGLVNFGRFQKSIQLFQIEHRGVSHARNFGVHRSRGEWICFLDSDDTWYPEKLKKQWDYHAENPGINFSQTNELWNKKGNLMSPVGKHKKISGAFLKESLNICLVTVSSFMASKKAWDKVGGFREELFTCEDYDLWNRILLSGEKIGLIEEELLVRYGGHTDQLSGQYPAMERFRLYSLLLTREEYRLLKRWDVVPIEEQNLWERAIETRFTVLISGGTKRGRDISQILDLKNLYAQGKRLDKNALGFLLSDSFQ